MKLYLMKRDALIFFKDNLEKFYAEYYRNPTNDWMTELYGIILLWSLKSCRILI